MLGVRVFAIRVLVCSILFVGSANPFFFGFDVGGRRHHAAPTLGFGFSVGRDCVGTCSCGGPIFDHCDCGRIHGSYCHDCYVSPLRLGLGFGFNVGGGRHFGGRRGHGHRR